MSHNTKEDAAGGALAGGAYGHHEGKGHTLRDAAVGGFIGDEAGKHENKKEAEGKPGLGSRVGGTVQEIIGKVTNNPDKVADGTAKKQGSDGGVV